MKNFSKIVPGGLLSAALLSIAIAPAALAVDTNTSASSSTSLSTSPMNTNWDTESAYWQNNYFSRPYYNSGLDYSAYEPAYHYGMDAYTKYNGKSYNDLDQAQLKRDWENEKGNSNLSWDQAQSAFRDSYNRLSKNHSNVGINSGTNTNVSGTTTSNYNTTNSNSNIAPAAGSNSSVGASGSVGSGIGVGTSTGISGSVGGVGGVSAGSHGSLGIGH